MTEPVPTRRAPAWVAATVLVLASLCLTLALPTIWLRNLVMDTDRYVTTVQPLADDPAVRAAVAARLDSVITARLDVTTLLSQAGVPDRLASALAPALQASVTSLVERTVDEVLTSHAFTTFWTDANRLAHLALVKALTGEADSGSSVYIDAQGRLVLDLQPLQRAVEGRLVGRGLALVAGVGTTPTTPTTLTIADVSGLVALRPYVSALDVAAWLLPVLGVLLAAMGLWLSARRRPAAVLAAAGTALGFVLLGLLLLLGRSRLLGAVAGTSLSPAAAVTVYDTLVRFLRDGVRWCALTFAVVAVVVLGLGWEPTAAQASWWHRWRVTIRIGVPAATATLLVLWDAPTPAVVATAVVLAALPLGLAERARVHAGASRPPVRHPETG